MRWGSINAVSVLAAIGIAGNAAAEPAGVDRSIGDLTVGPVTAELHAGVAVAAEGRTAFAVDRDGEQAGAGRFLSPRLRGTAHVVGPRGRRITAAAELEVDAVTGTRTWGSLPDGDGYAGDDAAIEPQLRKAFGRLAVGDRLQIGAGRMTSQWGLGLVANDGTDTFTPGSARFTEPRGGDRVLRAFAAAGVSRQLAAVVVATADSIVDDDVLLERDRAWQATLSIRVGERGPHSAGVYAAWRAHSTGDGGGLEVVAVDATASSRIVAGPGEAAAAIEAVVVAGTTTYAPTMQYAEHDVRQLAIAGRASYRLASAGAVVDAIYASGDRNVDDAQHNAFKADTNYDLGMLLFPHVLAAHTARAVATASDPELVGRPAPDLDRYPTRGAVSNTIAVFPRLWWGWRGAELYGGPLLAWTAVDLADPLATRIAGGTPTNALGAAPGRYLGTELDLGIRYHARPWSSRLWVSAEAAAFFPGSAFAAADGAASNPVYGARTAISYDL